MFIYCLDPIGPPPLLRMPLYLTFNAPIISIRNIHDDIISANSVNYSSYENLINNMIALQDQISPAQHLSHFCQLIELSMISCKQALHKHCTVDYKSTNGLKCQILIAIQASHFKAQHTIKCYSFSVLQAIIVAICCGDELSYIYKQLIRDKYFLRGHTLMTSSVV